MTNLKVRVITFLYNYSSKAKLVSCKNKNDQILVENQQLNRFGDMTR